MFSYKKYFSVLILNVALSLFFIGVINYAIDPASIYHESINSPSVYVTKLTQSKYGLIRPNNSWKEREIKRSLARQVDEVDCVVIGSSHVLQISSYRENRSLTNLCGSLINLGVSGGTLEDYLALSYEFVIRTKRPETIVFGVDPWSLDFQKDPRWQEYKISYENMVEYLDKSHNRILIDNIFIKWKLLVNLINLEYLLLSLDAIEIKKSSATKAKMSSALFREAPLFDLSKGIEEPVTLPDGSHVYSKEYIRKKTPPKVQIGGENYKIKKGTQVSEEAIKIFSNLIKKLNLIGINVVLIMTPYHQNVWADENSITTKALMEVEQRIKKLGKDLRVKVLGSYNPKNIGCNPDEFYDFMHAKDTCLSKVIN